MRALDPDIVRTVAFEIIEQCNFFCDFCVRSAHRKLTGQLGQPRFEERLTTIRECFPSVRHVALTGGEPFLHPAIESIAEKIVATGSALSITTNGSIRSRGLLEKLARLPETFLIVSLDGPSSLIHDGIRGFPGSFERIGEFTSICREVGLPFGANITVSGRNADSVFDTIIAARSLGAADVSVSLVKPEGRGMQSGVTPSVLVDVARQVERAKSALYGAMDVKFTEPLAHIFDVSVYQTGRGRTCGAGGSTLHVRCDGSVLLCTSCTQSLGSIDTLGKNLLLAWERDVRLQRIRVQRRLEGACGACPVVDFCGGCRCRAEKTSEFLGEDPLCPKVRSPERMNEATRVLQTAQARIGPSAARDPEALRSWLRSWPQERSLDRGNTNFSAQRIWGHDYPLDASETLQGEMGTRHIDVLWTWLAAGTIPTDLTGFRILDVGPWTGGEALLLAALGGIVDVVEEHPLYLETTLRLAQELNLPIAPLASSLYDLNGSTRGLYDIVYLSGIISHLSDPVLGLRIAFNSLADGGLCLLETQTSYAADGRDEFWGPARAGWVWWNLSRPTLLEMLHTVGFTRIQIADFGENRRIQVSAVREGEKTLAMRMGLSHNVS